MVHVMTTPGPLFRFAASVEVEDSEMGQHSTDGQALKI